MRARVRSTRVRARDGVCCAGDMRDGEMKDKKGTRGFNIMMYNTMICAKIGINCSDVE